MDWVKQKLVPLALAFGKLNRRRKRLPFSSFPFKLFFLCLWTSDMREILVVYLVAVHLHHCRGPLFWRRDLFMESRRGCLSSRVGKGSAFRFYFPDLFSLFQIWIFWYWSGEAKPCLSLWVLYAVVLSLSLFSESRDILVVI